MTDNDRDDQAIASHRLDQTRYERDELQEIAQWRRDNCWDTEAKFLDDEEE